MRRSLITAGTALLVLIGAACGDSVEVATPALPTPTEPAAARPSASPEPPTAPATARPSPTATPVPPAAPASVDLARLTEEWPCGFGFAVGNPDQTVGLVIQFEDFQAAEAGNVPPVGNIGTVIWSGRVQVGADLFANWCDDVLEPGEPTPRVDETWTIVEGDIVIVGQPPVQTSGSLTAVLTGLVAEKPDRSLTPLGDITIDNPFWGTFAG